MKKTWTAKERADFRARMVAAKKAKGLSGVNRPRKAAKKRRAAPGQKLAGLKKKFATKPFAAKKKPRAPKRKQHMNYLVVAVSKTDARIGYYDGLHFDTNKAKAAIFHDQAQAMRIAKSAKKPGHGYRVAVATSKSTKADMHVSGNPSPRGQSAKVQQAARLFEDFTGHEAGHTRKVLWTVPDVAAQFGELEGVIYNTVRDGKSERYLHKFKKKSRPLLGVSHDGKQLVVVGGHYQFTEAGIEDR